jgi:hypothetical protein
VARGQGTFAHIAYDGGYQTTFTFVNQSLTDQASLSLYFYGDTGTTLTPAIQGVANPTSPYSFTIPAGGSTVIVLPDSGAATSTTGWASLQSVNGVPVSGQGSFRRHAPPNPDYEMVVPLIGASSDCIVPFPASDATITIPFNNVAGAYITAIAIANATNSAQAVPIAFYDQSNNQLTSDTLNLAALNHTAFGTSSKYPATAGQQGVIRISAGIQNIAVLALMVSVSNPSAETMTSVLPITQ